MLPFRLLAQQLSGDFIPVKQSINQPDSVAVQVQNNLPDEKTPSERTAYIIDSNQCSRVPKQNKQTLYIILLEETEITLPPDWINNYILFSSHVDRTRLYTRIQKLIQKSFRISDAHYRLSCCLLERANIDTILKTGAEILGNPLFLSDTSTRVLYWSDFEQLKEVNDELIQCITKHSFVTSELFEKYNYRTFLPSIERTTHAFLQKSDYEEKKERLIVKVVIDHRYFGWIVVVPQKRSFEDGDCEILDILANILSLELEKNKIGFALSYRENLLLELLSGRITSLNEFKLRAEGFDWNLGEHFYTMAISFRDNNIPANKERTITAYKNHLGLIYPTYKAICIGNILYLLLETEDLDSVADNLENFFQTYHLVAGCSHHFSNILEFSKYVEQASEILHIGLTSHPEQTIYRYEDYYMPYLVSILKKHSNLQFFCLPELLALQDYDQKNDTCYMDTLRAYLEFRNAISTADYLHIHRNTLNYRLQKIREITHLKLTKGEDLYKIWFTFLILDFNSNE